jgi:predicted metal-dependent hydrolase
MTETIQLGDIAILVTRKAIKNVHLSVHPPDGRVTLAAPTATRLEVARAYAISKLGWIRQQQEKLRNQARETPRQFSERFLAILGEHYPTWREARAELNELPLTAEVWKE